MSELKTVTRDEFFKALHADKRDIMPTITGKWSDKDGYISEWRTNNGARDPFGRSTSQEPKTWQLWL